MAYRLRKDGILRNEGSDNDWQSTRGEMKGGWINRKHLSQDRK